MHPSISRTFKVAIVHVVLDCSRLYNAAVQETPIPGQLEEEWG